MLVRPLHDSKAAKPILITLLGIVMFVRRLQPAKENSPILDKLLGIVRLGRSHASKA